MDDKKRRFCVVVINEVLRHTHRAVIMANNNPEELL